MLILVVAGFLSFRQTQSSVWLLGEKLAQALYPFARRKVAGRALAPSASLRDRASRLLRSA